MKLVSIDSIPGKEYEVLGLVRGTVVYSKNFGRDFMAGLKTLVGGEIVGYTEMLNDPPENPPWYPMWSFSNSVTDETNYGKVMKQIDAAKHRYLPLLVMTSDFESTWEEYVDEYNQIDSQIYFDELTAEVRRRAEQQ